MVPICTRNFLMGLLGLKSQENDKETLISLKKGRIQEKKDMPMTGFEPMTPGTKEWWFTDWAIKSELDITENYRKIEIGFF